MTQRLGKREQTFFILVVSFCPYGVLFTNATLMALRFLYLDHNQAMGLSYMKQI